MTIGKDEIVKGEIIKQAQKLFQQFGLKKTTMDEIAEASGKAKSTIYHYFKSKEEVFDEVVQVEMRGLRVLVKNFVEEQKNVVDKLITYFITFHVEIMNSMNLYRISKNELKDNAKSRIYFHRLMDFEQSYLTRLLEDGYDAGEIKSIEKDEIPLMSETILVSFFGIVRYVIEREQEVDIPKLKRIANKLVPKIIN